MTVKIENNVAKLVWVKNPFEWGFAWRTYKYENIIKNWASPPPPPQQKCDFCGFSRSLNSFLELFAD